MTYRPSSTLANSVAPGVRPERIEPLLARVAGNRWRFLGFMVSFVLAIALFAAAIVAIISSAVAIAVVLRSGGGLPGNGIGPGGFIARAVTIGFAISLAATTVWSLVRLSTSEMRLLKRLGARMPAGGTLLPTKSALRDMALAAGLPRTPQLYVLDTPGVNAFVLGRSVERVRIGVTRGLLERTGPDVQRAVFANLIARVLTLDTLWATAVSALMGPIWAVRDADFRRDNEEPDLEAGATRAAAARDQGAGLALLGYAFVVIVTELLAWYHREAAWSAAEKADAEGMLLLKDPRWMLRGIEEVLERDNHVLAAGDAYSQLFFCWAGFGFAPEDDPEMRRVARLREALGAEGAAYVPRPNLPGWPGAPRAPRLEVLEQEGSGMPS